MRIQQWYKNLIIFLPLVFSLHLFSYNEFIVNIIGFIALGLVTTAGYIRNDIEDIELDRIHPSKSQRPIPSKKITINQAYYFFIAFLGTGLLISFLLNFWFGILIITLFVNMEIYSRFTKKIIFIDVFSISFGFIIRALSGIVLIQSGISPWLIMGVFFVALFLGFLKRKSEFETINDKMESHRSTLSEYTSPTLNSSILISAIMVITTYSLYSMNSSVGDWRLIFTIPIIVLVIMRQIHLSNNMKYKMITDEILRDSATRIAIIVYVILTIFLLYFAPEQIFKMKY